MGATGTSRTTVNNTVTDIDTQERLRYAQQLEDKADTLERELMEEMSSTEQNHSVGWRRAQRETITNLRNQSRQLRYQ